MPYGLTTEAIGYIVTCHITTSPVVETPEGMGSDAPGFRTGESPSIRQSHPWDVPIASQKYPNRIHDDVQCDPNTQGARLHRAEIYRRRLMCFGRIFPNGKISIDESPSVRDITDREP